ncbi:GIY-YIG nuclease family protein [Devosia sp. 66-22]|uniref:GIY-YIG nuclease family protein n=1 Tax=Devosia sp. 66-22 TaxID=1895753 RepID=UPI00092588A7|nr:GIY-YIG nuclease family protein [Devosia sp. 66-22]OJX53813.1 MAG: hypothetical protein BGO81_14815 [Devosia sp. 66-22]
MGAWVYIIRCADGSYYVGNTRKRVEQRFQEHVDGVFPGYTSARRPLELVYAEACETLIAAFNRERQIKGWSRRKKEALIGDRADALPALSRRLSVQRTPPRSPE